MLRRRRRVGVGWLARRAASLQFWGLGVLCTRAYAMQEASGVHLHLLACCCTVMEAQWPRLQIFLVNCVNPCNIKNDSCNLHAALRSPKDAFAGA